MIKFIYCVKRRADLSPEEFSAYWLNNHGPLVKRHANTIRAKKYVQSHWLDTPLNRVTAEARGMTQTFDGITEIWWDSAEDAIAAGSSAEGQEANAILAKDEANFCDLAGSSVFFTQEHRIF